MGTSLIAGPIPEPEVRGVPGGGEQDLEPQENIAIPKEYVTMRKTRNVK